MKQAIQETIRLLEIERDIRVLYACESGSRAWGFASPDSDYDLRFIYSHRREWYLELQENRDVIDLMLPNDLDLAGWDLRKSLRLFATCNLALNEWLDSPEIYWETAGFRDELAALIPDFFNPKKAIHHYLSIARNSADTRFDGERIKIKKLFYILRPLFACHWIRSRRSMPPTRFQEMLDADLGIDATILDAISLIQEQKAVAAEGHVIEPPANLREWIRESIMEFESAPDTVPASNRGSWGALNALMLKWMKEE